MAPGTRAVPGCLISLGLGAVTMLYRLYFYDVTGHSGAVQSFECISDAAACEIAEEQAGERPFELWQCDRMVIKRMIQEPPVQL